MGACEQKFRAHTWVPRFNTSLPPLEVLFSASLSLCLSEFLQLTQQAQHV